MHMTILVAQTKLSMVVWCRSKILVIRGNSCPFNVKLINVIMLASSPMMVTSDCNTIEEVDFLISPTTDILISPSDPLKEIWSDPIVVCVQFSTRRVTFEDVVFSISPTPPFKNLRFAPFLACSWFSTRIFTSVWTYNLIVLDLKLFNHLAKV